MLTKQQCLDNTVKAKRVIMGRLWLGTVCFTVGIGGLVLGGFYFHNAPFIYWIVSGGGGVLIALGMYLLSTC